MDGKVCQGGHSRQAPRGSEAFFDEKALALPQRSLLQCVIWVSHTGPPMLKLETLNC